MPHYGLRLRQGLQYRVFDAVQPNPQELELTYTAEDGEEGFPGNITCKVLMKLTDDNAIDIRYEAETDKPTIVNLLNLAGQKKKWQVSIRFLLLPVALLIMQVLLENTIWNSWHGFR